MTLPGPTRPKVELFDLCLKYISCDEETLALQGLSLSVPEGEFLALVGPSGCGKSTVLSLVAGLLRPTAGTVLIDGRPVSGTSRQIGYMLQQDYLFEWRTVLGNCLLGPEIQGMDLRQARLRVTELLEKYGLSGFSGHFPHQLSGGMRQRAALIRTLATDPEVLLLDEPFSALDYQTRLNLQDEVAGILRREGKTVIMVTHDIPEAIAMADRVVVMTPRPGRVYADYRIDFSGPPGSPGRPDAPAGRPVPLQTRNDPRFPGYFNSIWKDLNPDVMA